MSNGEIVLKITIVGDTVVGKTSLIIRCTLNVFPEGPTLPFDDHSCSISVDDKKYRLRLCDTVDYQGYERLRPLSYPNTDCFLFCYAIDNRESYENIKRKWWPEIQHYTKKIPIVLVATKLDLRVANSEKLITTEESHYMKEQIHAYTLVECSAKDGVNIQQVFEEAVRAVATKSKSKRQCRIL
ncbi:ras-like GTP-binding protein RhoL [Cochliomyia hominivorax]